MKCVTNPYFSLIGIYEYDYHKMGVGGTSVCHSLRDLMLNLEIIVANHDQYKRPSSIWMESYILDSGPWLESPTMEIVIQTNKFNCLCIKVCHLCIYSNMNYIVRKLFFKKTPLLVSTYIISHTRNCFWSCWNSKLFTLITFFICLLWKKKNINKNQLQPKSLHAGKKMFSCFSPSISGSTPSHLI